MATAQPIFCCAQTTPIDVSNSSKLHNDPNRPVHEAIYRSFMAFAARRERTAALICLLTGEKPSPEPMPPVVDTSALFDPEALASNPVTPNTPYVVHMTSRHDFGPVFSHRYFVCPLDLKEDWVEASLVEWFARSGHFKHTAEKWDLKCIEDEKFYRLSLRPNLSMRFHPQPQEEVDPVMVAGTEERIHPLVMREGIEGSVRQ